MPPVRTYTDWNKRPADQEDQIEPFRKYFFICEGENTEVWYFRRLIDFRKQLGIHPLIDIRLMEKTEEDSSLSNPKALLRFAESQKKIASNHFDEKHDKMIVVFDLDIYRSKPDQFEEVIALGGSNNILAVSNPSFELFLVLHYNNSFNEVIVPHEREILENQKVGNKRFIATLFTDISGMNSKTNPEIGELAKNINIAIEQEKHLNEDLSCCLDQLTCNIGRIIQLIRDDKLTNP